MIILDTHIWIWWVTGSSNLSNEKARLLSAHQADGLGVSAISCWETAKLVEKGRLSFTTAIEEWIFKALAEPGIVLLPLDPKIAIASTQLPAPFHQDPADQIITATARELNIELATDDLKMLRYPHVRLAWSN